MPPEPSNPSTSYRSATTHRDGASRVEGGIQRRMRWAFVGYFRPLHRDLAA